MSMKKRLSDTTGIDNSKIEIVRYTPELERSRNYTNEHGDYSDIEYLELIPGGDQLLDKKGILEGVK